MKNLKNPLFVRSWMVDGRTSDEQLTDTLRANSTSMEKMGVRCPSCFGTKLSFHYKIEAPEILGPRLITFIGFSCKQCMNPTVHTDVNVGINRYKIKGVTHDTTSL
jgi:hypothetical protein